MAKQTAYEVAVARLKSEIADRERALEALADAQTATAFTESAPKPKRGRKRKAGLPLTEQTNGE